MQMPCMLSECQSIFGLFSKLEKAASGREEKVVNSDRALPKQCEVLR